MKRSTSTIFLAFLFTMLVIGLGYAAFGLWTAVIFTSGFLGGFLLWICISSEVPYTSIKVPFLLAFGLFILHRVEEKVMGFFDALAEITGVETPEILSWQVILLVIVSVVAWVFIPFLVKRGYAFGYYLAWTFFAAMGITELAHFFFPFFLDKTYGYFPGMVSVILLAPVAWWGMYRLSRSLSR